MKNTLKKQKVTILIAVLIGLLATTNLFSQEADLIRNVQKNDLKAVQAQITAGADVNMIDKSDNFPLKTACISNHPEMVKLLITNGADINMQDSYNGNTALSWASSDNNLEIAKLLISEGADVNHLDKKGGSPLGSVCLANNIEIAKLLITNGADINNQDKSKGYTPLITACSYNYSELAKLLISSGADINLKAKDGSTALIQAAKNDPEIINLLLSKGADINARMKDGTGAFTKSIYGILMGKGSTEVAELFLSKGADINEAPTTGDMIGWTPLFLAVSDENENLVKFLIDNGANVNAKNNNGDTVLSMAVKNGNEKIIGQLKSHGAK